MKALVSILVFFLSINAFSKALQTNAVNMHDPPKWVTEKRVRGIAQKMENFLEWRIRRVNVYWYKDMRSFVNAHGLGSGVLAATNRKTHTIYMGPQINTKNFDGIFGHELAHVIVVQKYKQAIPLWLEEGLANYAAQLDYVDYRYLKSKPFKDVETLTHPFKRGADSKYHYHASTALMKMLAEKCPIRDLLQLSVGKKIETYIKTFCQIPDLNAAFKVWLQKRPVK